MRVCEALGGGTLAPIARVGDLENRISIGSAGAFLAKDLFKESEPYSKEYDINGVLSIYINLHFLAELRRQLSGVQAIGTSTFSNSEAKFYVEFQEYLNDVPKTGEVALALEALDDWLIEEITGATHNVLDREYAATHKWNKTELAPDDRVYAEDHDWNKTASYVYENGIKWI